MNNNCKDGKCSTGYRQHVYKHKVTEFQPAPVAPMLRPNNVDKAELQNSDLRRTFENYIKYYLSDGRS